MPRPAANIPSPLWLVPFALVGGTVVGNLYGRGPFFLLLAANALGGAIWVFWRSLQSLTGEAPLTLDEALGLGAPNAEEERKASVLRALKDLEYERTVGKIEDQDFHELSERYRAEARLLLQLVDEHLGAARQDVSAEVDARIAAELGAPAARAADSSATSASDAKSESPKKEAPSATDSSSDSENLRDA